MFNLITDIATLLMVVLTICVSLLGLFYLPMSKVYLLYALFIIVLFTVEDLYQRNHKMKEYK